MREKSEIAKIFAGRLKKLMREKELNMLNLSKAINIPNNTISGWLNLKRTPQIDSLDRIADFFNETVDYLLGRDKY